MRDFSAAREIVSRQGWLSHTPPEFRQTVLDRCLLEDFEAGAVIYMVGDPPGGMYGLVSGSFGVSVAPGERGPYLAHFARPGTWFGELPAFTGLPRRVGLAAARDTSVLHLPLHAIREIVHKDPGAWRFLAFVMIGHLEVALGAADDLLIRDHTKRCVAVLLRVAGCRRATPMDALAVDIDVSQDDLAAMANMARTTAGAILGKLEAAGLLEVSYRRIRILGPDALRAMLVDV
jgi:CRP/FNR family transcriptional regulator, cyclic AMP receptor protein